jgi:hypothetical protein
MDLLKTSPQSKNVTLKHYIYVDKLIDGNMKIFITRG